MFAPLILLVANTVHVHVDGEGYLRFVRDGRTVYARDASLTVVDGKLASTDGPTLNPRVQVPQGVTDIRVDLSGRVLGHTASEEKELGRIVLATFPHDVRLVVDGGFLVSSYRAELSDPGVGTAGVVRMGKRGVTQTTVTTTAAPQTVAGIEIRLRESAEIEGGSFILSQIAEVLAPAETRARLEALEVSTTPALGATFRMTQDMVRQRLLRYGKEAESYKFSGSNQVAVTRKGQEVTAAMFNEAAIKAARAEIGADTPLTAESAGISTMVPLGRLELVGENVTVNGSRLSVRVAIVVDGERINSRTVTLEKADPLSKMRVGQTVKVLVRSGAATVETTGRVRSIDPTSGTVVVTAATGAELIGKAVASDTVEVTL